MLKTLSRYLSSSNPYKVLGIPENSSKEQIKLAYYNIAKKYHPDINSHYPVFPTKEVFKAATKAYRELESQNFKYQETKTTQATESPTRKPRHRKSTTELDRHKKKLALFEVLAVLGISVVVLFKLILLASAKRKEQLTAQENQYLLEADLEKIYDEELQTIRYVQKA